MKKKKTHTYTFHRYLKRQFSIRNAQTNRKQGTNKGIEQYFATKPYKSSFFVICSLEWLCVRVSTERQKKPKRRLRDIDIGFFFI